MSANYIARWDGTAWSAVGSGMNDDVNALKVIGTDLYAGGYFDTAGGVRANYIARWDGSQWAPVGAGMNYLVSSLAAIGQQLYAGGLFTYPGGGTARWDGGTWSPLCIPTTTIDLRPHWNLVSLPRCGPDERKTSVFPSAMSPAYGYNGSYQEQETLRVGAGYWLEFNQAQTVSVSGAAVSCDTIAVAEGWNLIGALTSPVAAASIGSEPPGLATSSVWGFDHGYYTTDTLVPGQGYWIKVNQDGELILAVQGAGGVPKGAQIRTVLADTPPPPPNDDAAEERPIPKSYLLCQNYPNPFNPSTQIRYEIPEEGRVTLIVYDVLGREVARVVDEVKQAGRYTIDWDASAVPSGVYSYRLNAGGLTVTKKMMMTK